MDYLNVLIKSASDPAARLQGMIDSNSQTGYEADIQRAKLQSLSEMYASSKRSPGASALRSGLPAAALGGLAGASLGSIMHGGGGALVGGLSGAALGGIGGAMFGANQPGNNKKKLKSILAGGPIGYEPVIGDESISYSGKLDPRTRSQLAKVLRG